MRSRARAFAGWRGLLLVAVLLVQGLMLPARASAATLPLTSQHLTTTATCALVSYPATSAYSTDTYVGQGIAEKSKNFGTVTTMLVESLTNKNRRLYLRFDLTQCLFAPPAGATVRSATLRLFETVLPPACETFDVFREASTWGETTVTWNSQPSSATANQPPTAQATSQSVTVGTPGTCGVHTANSYVTWDVKADVVAFLGGTATNFGWMIRDDTEDQGTAQTTTFATRELGTLADAPQLLVTYTMQ